MLSDILLFSSMVNLTFCETEKCTDFANFLLSGMNQMVDPCENFYEFVCGSWSTTCPVSESRPFCNIDTEIDDRIQKILRDILEAVPNQNESKALSLEKEWYKACTDQV
ncbi:neprilysin-1-like [Belonocnema kinseyi]|uniref:neprilysin-1-like n=1 Tax=Belonocnema kinseyi TaxID=2817044 RepID=UPI00143D3F90|nr:neprilysin-1-like [Belonocnema kinseyi]